MEFGVFKLAWFIYYWYVPLLIFLIWSRHLWEFYVFLMHWNYKLVWNGLFLELLFTAPSNFKTYIEVKFCCLNFRIISTEIKVNSSKNQIRLVHWSLLALFFGWNSTELGRVGDCCCCFACFWMWDDDAQCIFCTFFKILPECVTFWLAWLATEQQAIRVGFT